LYVVYANKPYKRATVHKITCHEYIARKADITENGRWIELEDSDNARFVVPFWVLKTRRCSKCP